MVVTTCYTNKVAKQVKKRKALTKNGYISDLILSTLGYLRAGASKTAQFIDKFDKLFNAFNSVSVTISQPFRHAITNTSQHLEFLQNAMEILNGILKPDGKSVPCLEGCKTSVNALLKLWPEVNSHRFKFQAHCR